MADDQDVVISVIVPVWNNPTQLRTCLDALAAQSFPASSREIIVVDNGSSDETPDVARTYSGVQVLVERQPGSYAARNTGIARARGRHVAFTDSDCIPDPDWLQAAVTALKPTKAGLAAGPIELFGTGDQDGVSYMRYERMFSFPQDPDRGNCATANWASPRAAILAAGGFDSTLKSGADKQLALRIASLGYETVFVPDMVVAHPVRASMRELMNKRLRLTGGRWLKLNHERRLPTALKITGVEAIRRLQRIMRSDEHRVPEKANLALLVIWFALVSSVESMRLAVGGKPVR